MKKIKNIITGFVISLGLFSCNDLVEFERDFIITGDAIQSVVELERLVLGTYNSLNAYRSIMDFNSIGSDEVRIGLGNRGQGLQTHAFILTTNDALADFIWDSSYDVLDNVNRNLDFADIVPTEGSADIDLVNQLRGELLGIRAWQHFDLLRMYAPTFDNNSPGVPLANRVFIIGEDDFNVPRNTVGEVLEQINADIEEALTLLPETGDVRRLNATAIRALQARIAIYTGDYTTAISAATSVIDAVPLSDPTEYIDMFRDVDSEGAAVDVVGETIFELDRDQFDVPRVGTIWSDINLDVFFSMSVDLFDEVSENGDDDPRFLTNFDLEDVITERTIPFVNDTIFVLDDEGELTDEIEEINPIIDSITGESDVIVGKYLGSPEAPALDNIIIFRSSEMWLIRAEANARLNNLPEARDDILNLREVRNSLVQTPVYSDQNDALTDILAERRVELAFEGHRLLDLKRFGLGIDRIEPDCSGDGRQPTTCVLQAGSFRFTLPIPQDEIFANDGISSEDQNPGY